MRTNNRRQCPTHVHISTLTNKTQLQSADDSCTPEQLSALDARTADLRSQTTALHASAKTLRSALASLQSTFRTADLVSSVQALEAEKAGIDARLQSLRAGHAKKVTVQEREAVEARWKKSVKAARKREKIAGGMWAFISEQLPDKEMREQLREAFDLDG